MGGVALADELARLDATEVLVPDGTPVPPPFARRRPGHAARSRALRPLPRCRIACARATGAIAMDGLGVDAVPAAMRAAGAVLAYCERARIVISPDLLRLQVSASDGAMRLDAHTRMNLELFTRLGGSGTSLLQLLDATRTPMGVRMLRARLHEPLIDVADITRRLNSVTTLHDARDVRRRLRDALGGCA